MNYGLTYEQVRVMVYDYARILPSCKYPKNWNTHKKAGVDWLYGFMRRNRTLSLRKPESTSLARGLGFNRNKVNEFFNNYKNVLEKYKFTPERIFNLDETGVTTVLNPPKVIATKGKKQIGLIASAERGELVTVVGIINATGTALPPVYIFPRVRNIEEYLEGSPASSAAFGNKSGWMTGELFVKTLEHIVKHTKCNRENKILLLMDNHESHTTLDAILYARENGVVLLSFPPHTSHKLQPLDIGVFGPFKSKCSVSLNEWLSSNPGKTVTVKLIPKLTKIPFLEAFTPRNITSSFEKPGIWPVNSLGFTDQDFEATLVFNDNEPTGNPLAEKQDGGTENDLIEREDFRNQPSTSKEAVILPVLDEVESESSVKTNAGIEMLTPEVVRPLPKVFRPKTMPRKPKANQGKSRIYTETPEKKRIEEIEENKKTKQKNRIEKEKGKLKRPYTDNESVKNKKIKQVKKKVFSSSSSESSGSDFDYDSETEENLSFGSLQEEDKIELNNFILVKFSVKNTTIHYIGCVQNIISDNTYQVKYLRRRANTNKFHFPQVDDIEMCTRNDVYAILTNPIKSRRDSSLTFCYNFDNINVK